MKQVQNQTPTLESVWAALQETDRLLKESRANWEESRTRWEESRTRWEESDAKFERRMEESSAKFDREREKSNADWDLRMKKLSEQIGGMANNHGSFAEEYFFNSFENGRQNFFGEKFDEIERNLKHHWQGVKDEYDIVLYNHASVALMEVKYKAHQDDIPKVLKKAETFRILFPHYKDFQVYLGLASMSFYPALEQECIKQGVAIIKQVGDTVVIHDAHLKVF